MALFNVLAIAVMVWITFYLIVYVVFVTPDSNKPVTSSVSQRNLKVANTPFDKVVDTKPIKIVRHPKVQQDATTTLDSNPFVSKQCKVTIFSQQRDKAVAVVIPVRNEKKSTLLQTVSLCLTLLTWNYNDDYTLFHKVTSVVKNSNNLLNKIIIVDDFSTDLIR